MCIIFYISDSWDDIVSQENVFIFCFGNRAFQHKQQSASWDHSRSDIQGSQAESFGYVTKYFRECYLFKYWRFEIPTNPSSK